MKPFTWLVAAALLAACHDFSEQTACANGARICEVELEIEWFTPSSGAAAGGQRVEIRGSGFDENTQVLFGVRPALVTDLTSTSVVVETPEHPPQEAVISVISAGKRVTAENTYRFEPTP